MVHDQCRGRVASNHNDVRLVRLYQIADERNDARNDFGFGVLAVGEICVVSDIDVVRAGAQPHDLAQHGISAEARIEHQNRLRHTEIKPDRR